MLSQGVGGLQPKKRRKNILDSTDWAVEVYKAHPEGQVYHPLHESHLILTLVQIEESYFQKETNIEKTVLEAR